MATELPNVRTYLSNSNFEALQEYAKNQNIKSLSSAINGILTQYFNKPPKNESMPSTEDRLTTLEKKVAHLEKITK